MGAVKILGSGPAALFAAHALLSSGWKPREIEFFSERGFPTSFPGSQFLHKAIPRLTERIGGSLIEMLMVGSPAVYAAKGGGDPRGATTWDNFRSGEPLPCWPLRDACWWIREGLSGSRVNIAKLHRRNIPSRFVLSRYGCTQEQTIISTIPPSSYCADARHWFSWYGQWITPGLPQSLLFAEVEPDFVIYNGGPESWVRASSIFGEDFTEWPNDDESRATPGVFVRKPIETNCDCRSDILRVGRIGKWDKEQHIHDAYFDVIAAIEEGRIS